MKKKLFFFSEVGDKEVLDMSATIFKFFLDAFIKADQSTKYELT